MALLKVSLVDHRRRVKLVDLVLFKFQFRS